MSYEVYGEPDEMPECQSCKDAAKDYEELEKVVDDLAKLVARLAYSLELYNQNSALSIKAMDYLKRNKLTGSPLRNAQEINGPKCNLNRPWEEPQ